MSKKKLIGYDLDGTLVDTRRDIICGVKYMLAEMGKPLLTDVEIERFVGEGLHHLVGMSMGETDPKTIERGTRILRKYYEAHLLDFTQLYPRAQELLERFKERIQIVVTNKPEPFTSRILEELHVMPYLSGVFTGGNGFPHKPDPAALLHVMREHNIAAKDVLWIGDSAVDAQTGKNAGVETVLVRHGFASRQRLEDLGADFLVDDFAGFLKRADQHGW